MSFKVNNIYDLELLYSLLREKHPKNKIIITYNYNIKEYFLKVSDELFEDNPEIPLDVDIEVIYGKNIYKILKTEYYFINFKTNVF